MPAPSSGSHRSSERWLRGSEYEPLAGSATSYSPSGLFFGASADLEALREQVAGRRRRAEHQLRELEEIEREIDREADFFPYVTLLHGLEDARSTIAWTDRALAELARRARKGARALA